MILSNLGNMMNPKMVSKVTWFYYMIEFSLQDKGLEEKFSGPAAILLWVVLVRIFCQA